MGALTKISLLTKHTQYLSLLKDVDLPFPSVYLDFLSFTDLVNLDIEFFAVMFKDFPFITFRMRFIFVCVLIPLLIVMLTLLAFLRFSWIMWGALSFMGIMMLMLRLFVAVGRSSAFPQWAIDQTESKTFLLTAIMMVGICALYIGLFLTIKRMQKSKIGYYNLIFGILHIMLEPTTVVSAVLLLRTPAEGVKVVGGIAILWCILVAKRHDHMSLSQLIVFACILVGVSVGVMVVTDPNPEAIPSQMGPFGFFLLAIGLIGMVLKLAVSNSTTGVGSKFTKARAKLQQVLDKGLLTITFFFLSLALVPVVTAAVEMFMCVEFVCPTGYRFNPYPDNSDEVYTTSVHRYCDPCSVSSTACAFDADSLCPHYSEQRLLQHPETVCDSVSQPTYMATAGSVLVVFVVVISWMYLMIINEISEALAIQTAETHVKMVKENKQLRESYNDRKLEYDRYKEKKENLKRQRQQEIMQFGEGRRAPGGDGGANKATNNNQIKGTGEADDLDLGSFDLADISSSSSSSAGGSSNNSDGGGGRSGVLQTPALHKEDLLGDDLDVELLPRAAATVTEADVGSSGGGKASSPTLDSTNKDNNNNNNQKATTRRLHRVKQPAIPSPTPDYDDAFAAVSTRVTPKASSLYAPFRHPMRHFLVIDNLHRVLLVLCTVVISPLVDLGGVLFMALQVGMLVFLCLARPFHNTLELALSILISFCDVLSGLYVTLLWVYPNNSTLTSNSTGIVLIVVSFAVPVLATIVLQGVSWYTSYHDPYTKAAKDRVKEEKKTRRAAISKSIRKLDYELRLCVELGESPKAQDEIRGRRDQLMECMKQPLAETKEQITTRKLDALTKARMLRVFVMFCTPVFMIAAIVTIMTVYEEQYPNYRVASDAVDRSAKSVLADRTSWQQFTAECCCFESAFPMTGYLATERWVCMEGLPANFSDWPVSFRQSYFEANSNNAALGLEDQYTPAVTLSKNRVDSKLVDDGRLIRPMCSVQLPSECEVQVDAGGVTSFVCTPSDYATSTLNATEYAARVLW